VRSTIPALYVALTLGAFAALVAEFGKYGALRLQMRRAFWLVGAYQVVLLCESLRIGANDWWIWSLYWAGILNLRNASERSYNLSLPLPWIALVACFVVCSLAFFEARRSDGLQGN